MSKASIGSIVKIKKGVCGEGYTFTISSIDRFIVGTDQELQVYGNNDSYGPIRISDIIVIKS